MAPSSPDRRRRGLLVALAAAGALLFLQPAVAASDKCETKEWKVGYDTSRGGVDENWSFTVLKLSQCSTLLQAAKADATGVKEGNIENSTWKLTGAVHLEVDGAVLDADAATLVLVDGRVKSVDVQTVASKKPVHIEFSPAVLDVDSATVAFTDGRIKTIHALGTPAQFSYLLKKSGQRVHGHSPRIDYDANKTQMDFVDASYFLGNNDFNTELLKYNITDGSMETGKANAVYRPDDKVPAPRTPDRTSAK